MAEEEGSRAFLVGGPVRDLILGLATRDLDCVIVGDATRLAAELGRKLGGRVRAHPSFGTATVELPDDGRLDLATARCERYSGPAALPQVVPAGLEQDLQRRDFTINCVALDLSPHLFGRLLDPLEGRADIDGRRIRVLHAQSFRDDPTRTLRAVRFASRLGFRIARGTGRLLREASGAGLLRRLSAARLRREVAATLDEPELARTLSMLDRYGVLHGIDNALSAGRAEVSAAKRLHRLYANHHPAAQTFSPDRWVAALALLTLGASRRQRRRLVQRLRPDRRSARLLLEARPEVSLLRRKLASPHDYRGPGAVHDVCRGFSDLSVMMLASTTRRKKLRDALGGYLERGASVHADISGEDLLAAGVHRGPGIAVGLAAALRAKLDGHAAGKAAQLAVALEAARRHRPRRA
jgi:tRNA nucleotidyltransferase (CCA-adding enzyme)